ncbi:hypothetical protein SAY86_025345 [Trapa natans]|uniref:non-specific serine/threonine protein kinase n=1 Tax=Trapa natans TaxID=22666 RepID=A0AAN7M627_TRANT|nr:hypothetical protein SAY86_025345 [Trapa natans]
MAGSGCFLLLLAFSVALLLDEATAQVPGFQSWNCGGKENFIDEAGIEWTPDNLFIYGHIAQTNRRSRAKLQYATLRYFPTDNRKYCYSLSVMPGMRYLLRPTFLYGNFDGKNVYPKFQISLGVTYWSTIIISNVNTVEAREMIFLATEPAIHMCLFNATRGRPFISTLELRPFNGSMYSNDLEEQFYVSVSARINFGAVSDAAIRYPDDPFDRIWYSDHSGKPNEVLPMADGIKNLSTDRPIDVGFGENPPQKVMQTAVLGTSGLLSYKLKLHGFAGNGWVISYFAEIEDFGPQRSRKFRVAIPFASIPHTDRPAVNIQENSGGKFRLCEHYSVNVTLNSLLSFEFIELPNSSEGPLLNAMEISKYIEIKRGSPDADVAAKIFSSLRNDDWAQEGGDPCLPVNWSWLLCSSESAPRITSILLSGKNLTGNIPSEFTKLTQLKVLRLDGNSFIGSIPDFTNCQDLKIIHLENNQLTGSIPPSLANLQKLRELYLQNNMLSGKVPIGLFRKNLVLNISGNVELEEGGKNPIALMIVVPFIIVAVLAFYTYIMNKNNRESQNAPSHQSEGQAEPPQREAIAEPSSPVLCAAHRFRFSEMKDATNKFQRKIGSGGFGVVYYGMLKNGREIAVKVLSSNSKHGEEEFLNEVTILSRAHHTNLVELLGYCQEDGKSMLVYEYAPNGNLEEHLARKVPFARTQTWMQRLSIAEGAARGKF